MAQSNYPEETADAHRDQDGDVLDWLEQFLDEPPYRALMASGAKVWLTKDRRVLLINEMTDSHLINTFHFLIRRAVKQCPEPHLTWFCEELAKRNLDPWHPGVGHHLANCLYDAKQLVKKAASIINCVRTQS